MTTANAIDPNPYLFPYKTRIAEPASCEVRIYEHKSKKIIIVSDVGIGPRISDNIEVIATELERIGVEWKFFVEHYNNPVPSFSFVAFTWNEINVATNPRWSAVSEDVVRKLIGVRKANPYG